MPFTLGLEARASVKGHSAKGVASVGRTREDTPGSLGEDCQMPNHEPGSAGTQGPQEAGDGRGAQHRPPEGKEAPRVAF